MIARLACQAARTDAEPYSLVRIVGLKGLLCGTGNMLTSRKRHMNRLSSSTPPRENSTHERAIEALAQASHVPIDHVAQLYAHELAVLTVGARITGFLPLLTVRKVREILRQRSHPARASAAPASREVDGHAHE